MFTASRGMSHTGTARRVDGCRWQVKTTAKPATSSCCKRYWRDASLTLSCSLVTSLMGDPFTQARLRHGGRPSWSCWSPSWNSGVPASAKACLWYLVLVISHRSSSEECARPCLCGPGCLGHTFPEITTTMAPHGTGLIFCRSTTSPAVRRKVRSSSTTPSQ